MVVIRDTVTINALPLNVWKTIQNPQIHPTWHPFVTHIAGEHSLSFTRVCRESCTLFDEEHAILWNIDEDTSGFSKVVTNWGAPFLLYSEGEKTIVIAESNFAVKNTFPHFMLPLIKVKFHGVQKQILKDLKKYVENN